MASPLTGTAVDETFDVFPYAKAAGEYLLTKMPGLHMPRKLKVGFSNTPANEVHATFRDLGFVAKENGTFSVYCAGGLGPSPAQNPEPAICRIPLAKKKSGTISSSLWKTRKKK